MLSRSYMKKIYDALFSRFEADIVVESVSPCTGEVVFLTILYYDRSDYAERGKDVWIGLSKTLMTQLRSRVSRDVFMRELDLSCPPAPREWCILPRDGADELKASIGEAVATKVQQLEPETTYITGAYDKVLIASASSLEELLLKCDLATTEKEACTCWQRVDER